MAISTVQTAGDFWTQNLPGKDSITLGSAEHLTLHNSDFHYSLINVSSVTSTFHSILLIWSRQTETGSSLLSSSVWGKRKAYKGVKKFTEFQAFSSILRSLTEVFLFVLYHPLKPIDPWFEDSY
jgi:hypothetical protein